MIFKGKSNIKDTNKSIKNKDSINTSNKPKLTSKKSIKNTKTDSKKAINNTKMNKNQSTKLKPKTLRDENISILDKKDKFAVITEEGKIENFITIRKEVSNNDTPLFKLSLWNQIKIALVDYDKKKGYSKKRAEKRKQKEEQKRAVDAQKLKKFLLEQGKNLGNDDLEVGTIIEHSYAYILDEVLKSLPYDSKVVPINENYSRRKKDIPIFIILSSRKELYR